MKIMQDELEKKAELLRLAGGMLNSIVEGLSQVDLETRRKIMELCGEACARAALFGVSNLDVAERIEEEVDEEEILERANEELLWCGT